MHCSVIYFFFSEIFLIRVYAVDRALCTENLSEAWHFEKGIGGSAPVSALGQQRGWVFQLHALTLHPPEEDA